MREFFRRLFSSDGFMPHGHCYLWSPEIVWPVRRVVRNVRNAGELAPRQGVPVDEELHGRVEQRMAEVAMVVGGDRASQTPANYADLHMLTRATSELSMWIVTTLIAHRCPMAESSTSSCDVAARKFPGRVDRQRLGPDSHR